MAYTDSEVRTILQEYPHGGGEYYANKLDPATADVSVSTASELQEATGPNNVVRVTGNINLTGWEIDLGNSTLVGDRGWGGSKGPILHSDTHGSTRGGAAHGRPYAMLYATGSDTPRVTGLRLRGYYNSTSPRSYSGDEDLQRGIWLNGNGGEVDNCELYGFTWACVMVGGLWSSYGENHGVHVHHCVIHRTLQRGYGYGINFARGSGDVDHCYFNRNRHSVNGQGRHFCSYTATECIFGPNMIGHMVDMHCLTESGHSNNPDPSDPDFGLRAGGAVEARNCTFLENDVGVGTARGEPWEYFRLVDNWISHSSIPTRNSGNNRSGAWYQQNIHGITANGTTYPRLAPYGEYTSKWTDTGNRTGANDESVSWTNGVGALVNLGNPQNSPAYHGYADTTTPSTHSVTVTVTGDDGSTLTHAEVTLGGMTRTTGPDGSVTYDELDPGDYSVTTSAVGWVGETRTVSIIDSDVTEAVTLVNNPDEWRLHTDANGRADLGAQPFDATYSYEISKSGYYNGSGTVINDSDGDVRVRLSPEGYADDRVSVAVTTTDGTPIEGVTVGLYSEDGSGAGAVSEPAPAPEPEPEPETVETVDPADIDVLEGEVMTVAGGESTTESSPFVIAGAVDISGELRIQDDS